MTRQDCIHRIKSFTFIPRENCNFSGYPIIIAKLFGCECPFIFDEDKCVGYVSNPDPRTKYSQDDI